jgi:hypothetical protein
VRLAHCESNTTDVSDDDTATAATETTHTTRSRTESTITPAVRPYSIIIGTLLPTLRKLVTDDEPSVRAAACDVLVNVSSVIHPDDHMEHVLSVALVCANHEEEDIRMTAAALLNLVAPFLGQVRCECVVVVPFTQHAGAGRLRGALSCTFVRNLLCQSSHAVPLSLTCSDQSYLPRLLCTRSLDLT